MDCFGIEQFAIIDVKNDEEFNVLEMQQDWIHETFRSSTLLHSQLDEFILNIYLT
jgi:hypothetical protein